MSLSFNIAGPCIPGQHYMLPPQARLGRVMKLIDQRKYFTLHAGRQTGKTTSLRWIEGELNRRGTHRAVWVDLEMAREETDLAKAVGVILENITCAFARKHPDLQQPSEEHRADLLAVPQTAVRRYLGDLAALDPLPLVVLFDEADGLVGQPMVSFLTQLRQGYIEREDSPFPSSVALVGQRQVRDYALTKNDRHTVSWLGTTSPFNITAEAATLALFTEVEVGELLLQHTTATGQVFEPGAVQRIAYLAQGHPWLTNALADQIVTWDVEDRAVPITAAHVDAAKETIILERRTHIDSLVSKLREPRVRGILDAMLTGNQTRGDVLDDDFAYVLGLGLVRRHEGQFQIANPIYREIIPRALTDVRQGQIPNEPAWYVRADGSLDLPKLMLDWQIFWREDGHLAASGFSYQEAGPHLMLMAFLQRIINGGGQILREYGLGRGALDLVITWKSARYVIEVKLRRDKRTEERALQQVSRYLDQLGLSEGWLVLFDLRKTSSWAEKLTLREVSHGGKIIHVVGC